MIEDKPNDEIKEEIFECKMYITDLETNKNSKEISITDLIFDDNLEFEFGNYEDEDYGKLSYKDFKFFINDYSVTFYSPQYKQALDSITTLQQENEYLKKNQRFHKKFGSDYIFCLEGDKETYKDMVLEKQEEIEQLQQAVKESINLLWKSDISTSKGLEIINILRSCLKSE